MLNFFYEYQACKSNSLRLQEIAVFVYSKINPFLTKKTMHISGSRILNFIVPHVFVLTLLLFLYTQYKKLSSRLSCEN